MKKIFFLIAMFFALTLSAQVKVGDNPTTVHSSAMLQVDSSTKGFLPPRMNNVQMSAIATPANGLMVYCTDCSPAGLYTYSGSAWSAVGDTSSGGSSSSGGVSASMAINGTYTWGATHTGRTIVITISNQSFSAVTWTNAIADLVLTGNSGLTVGTPTATGFPIASGGTGTISFPITGTVGTADNITATWTKLALTVVGTKTVTAGSATFTNATNNAFVFSANASGVNTVGTLAIGTTLLLPYTAGSGSYSGYTSPDIAIPSQYCNDGETNWTFAYSYPAGTFAATGNLTATLITKKGGTITAWNAFQVTDIATINFDCVSAPLVVNGATLSNTVGIDEGGDAIRGQLTTRAANYDAAQVDDWVAISLAEYNLLKNSSNIAGAGTYLMSDTNMNAVSSSINLGDNTTFAGSVGLTSIPSGKYIYAVRFKSSSTGSFNSWRAVIRFNYIIANGGPMLPLGYGPNPSNVRTAGYLTNHFTPSGVNGDYCFVLKRPTQKTTSSSLISLYCPSLSFLGAIDGGTTYYSATGVNTANLSGTASASLTPKYQALATSIKSW